MEIVLLSIMIFIGLPAFGVMMAVGEQNARDAQILYAETTSKLLMDGRSNLSAWPDEVQWYDTQQRIAGLSAVRVRDAYGVTTRRYLPEWRVK